MYNPFKNFSDSLSNNDKGWSGRKMTAFLLMLCIAALHIFYITCSLLYRDFSLFIDILITDLLAVAFFLGLVTVANIIELRNGSKTNEPIKKEDENINPNTTN